MESNFLSMVLDIETLRHFPLWLSISYVAVLVAMGIDFVSGVIKARRAGYATRSRGYKMTCDKAVKYFLPMLCLTCVDVVS